MRLILFICIKCTYFGFYYFQSKAFLRREHFVSAYRPYSEQCAFQQCNILDHFEKGNIISIYFQYKREKYRHFHHILKEHKIWMINDKLCAISRCNQQWPMEWDGMDFGIDGKKRIVTFECITHLTNSQMMNKSKIEQNMTITFTELKISSCPYTC